MTMIALVMELTSAAQHLKALLTLLLWFLSASWILEVIIKQSISIVLFTKQHVCLACKMSVWLTTIALVTSQSTKLTCINVDKSSLETALKPSFTRNACLQPSATPSCRMELSWWKLDVSLQPSTLQVLHS